MLSVSQSQEEENPLNIFCCSSAPTDPGPPRTGNVLSALVHCSPVITASLLLECCHKSFPDLGSIKSCKTNQINRLIHDPVLQLLTESWCDLVRELTSVCRRSVWFCPAEEVTQLLRSAAD